MDVQLRDFLALARAVIGDIDGDRDALGPQSRLRSKPEFTAWRLRAYHGLGRSLYGKGSACRQPGLYGTIALAGSRDPASFQHRPASHREGRCWRSHRRHAGTMQKRAALEKGGPRRYRTVEAGSVPPDAAKISGFAGNFRLRRAGPQALRPRRAGMPGPTRSRIEAALRG